jgi:hypothetical protein
MALTRLEREIITDSMLKIQSVQASLDQLDRIELLDRPEIDSCLESANSSLRVALHEGVVNGDPAKN